MISGGSARLSVNPTVSRLLRRLLKYHTPAAMTPNPTMTARIAAAMTAPFGWLCTFTLDDPAVVGSGKPEFDGEELAAGNRSEK